MFNGHEYASVEEMPAAARQLYEQVLATIEPGAAPFPATPTGSSAAPVHSTQGSVAAVAGVTDAPNLMRADSRRLPVMIALALAALLLVWFLR